MTTTVRRRRSEPTKRAGNGRRSSARPLAKAPTGISGLDEITEGGLPRGRPTLVCGSAGCGKTLLGMQCLVCGARAHDEPGLFVSFEESAEELTENVASIGWDLPAMQAEGRLGLEH